MSDNHKFNIVRFLPDDPSGDGEGGVGIAILLESPFKLSAGMKPNTNHALCHYLEFQKLGTGKKLGITGIIQFFGESDSDPDIEIKDITLIDAQPFEYRTPKGQDAAIATQYHLYFIDKRYAFVEPRGGRLVEGLINPSSQQPQDPDQTQTVDDTDLHDLIILCLAAMGQDDIDVPDTDAKPPRDLKWFGTHAPTELSKLLGAANFALILQPDGTFEVHKLGDGDDPSIPDGQQLPTVDLSGADGRGDKVVFASFPTQQAVTFTELTLPDDAFEIVALNSNGAWQAIDASGAYGDNAIAEMNLNFPNTKSPKAQHACYRSLRLDPDLFDPSISPIFRRTWAEPGAGAAPGDEGGDDAVQDSDIGLPPQIEIQLKAKIAVQDPVSKKWNNATDFVDVPLAHKAAGNVLVSHLRLVKLRPSTTDSINLEQDCIRLDLSSDIKIRFSVGDSKWDSGSWTPQYFFSGFSGKASSPVALSDSDAQAAMKEPNTIIIPIAELQAVRFATGGEADAEAPFNKDQLNAFCQSLAPRYLKDPDHPPKIMAGAGWFGFTLDGSTAEVEIDQQTYQTRFTVNGLFRASSEYLASEFRRFAGRGGVGGSGGGESHPHEAPTQGKKTAMSEAGSSQPIEPLGSYSAESVPGDFVFLVHVTPTDGSFGSSTTTCDKKYTVKSLDDKDLPDGSSTTSIGKTPIHNDRVPNIEYSLADNIGTASYGNASPRNLVLLTVSEKSNGAPCAT